MASKISFFSTLRPYNPLFWPQTDLAQWDHILPISPGNFGCLRFSGRCPLGRLFSDTNCPKWLFFGLKMLCLVWSGLVWSALLWYDPFWSGLVLSSLVQSVPVLSGPVVPVQSCPVQFSLVHSGLVWSDLVCSSPVWSGLVWSGPVRFSPLQ